MIQWHEHTLRADSDIVEKIIFKLLDKRINNKLKIGIILPQNFSINNKPKKSDQLHRQMHNKKVMLQTLVLVQ